MNAAAGVVSDTGKFDRGLTQILHDDLHWLDVADRVTYKLGVIMHRCRHGKAPQYLVDCCTPVTDVVGRQRLRSATQQLMVVPRHRLSNVGRRAFAVHGPWSGTQLDPENHVSVGAYYGVQPRQQVVDRPRIDTVNFVRKMT